MFNPDLFTDLEGPVLALDLDIVITGNLDEMADYAPGKVCMRSAFAPRGLPHTYGEGSFTKFEPTHHGFLFEEMARDPVSAVRFAQGSEQTYVSTLAHNRGILTAYPEDWALSFKHHCRPMRLLNLLRQPILPENARVICFHGRPNVDEAANGYRSDPLHSTRKCQWIIDNWS